MTSTFTGMDAGIPAPQYATVADIRECIETNLFLAEAYHKNGADGLRDEAIEAAYLEYTRFNTLMDAHAYGLGDKIKSLMAQWELI